MSEKKYIVVGKGYTDTSEVPKTRDCITVLTM